ncbi:hypothetical protein G5V57_18180 [Nordella sp. HKS 07]|uniref:hypothetical protein n=1 Tax=Nordella sp. HKS 07 TaxID=2712222 RepID=UPI0013E13993|nr:hypothetical protein [Nordella sp. HKS 07]QIG49473.1 hypothetical protein G5V57_18180 [Nordella sp. HKS 07]
MAGLTTEPPVRAWIVKRVPGSPRYSVRIGVGPTTHSAIEEDQWAVVLDDSVNVSEVGRIPRIRSDLDAVTIDFHHRPLRSNDAAQRAGIVALRLRSSSDILVNDPKCALLACIDEGHKDEIKQVPHGLESAKPEESIIKRGRSIGRSN